MGQTTSSNEAFSIEDLQLNFALISTECASAPLLDITLWNMYEDEDQEEDSAWLGKQRLGIQGTAKIRQNIFICTIFECGHALIEFDTTVLELSL